MTDQIELELKLQFIDPNLWELVFALPIIQQWGDQQSYTRERLEAFYYDTPSQQLQKAHLAYRIRREGGELLATVKEGGSSSGGLHKRAEWTVVVAEHTPDVEPFADMPIGPLLNQLVGDEELTALYTTCFDRQRMLIYMPDGSCVELAADQGEICAGEQKAPILELELELKAGHPSAVLQLGAAIAKELPLLPERRSKYFRALQLVGLAEETGAKLVSPIVEGEKSGAGLAKLLIFNIQAVLLAQENFLLKPEDQETIHQLRIQLRRLRSLISFGEPVLSNDTCSTYADYIQQWGNNLGPVREVDVVLEAWQEMLAGGTVKLDVSPVLSDKLASKRTELVSRVQQDLANGVTTSSLLELWARLAEYQQQSMLEQEVTLEDFARERLAEWAQKLIGAGKKLDTGDAQAMHKVRIRGKKLRYVLESLLPLWPEKGRRMIERFKELQDVLGVLHDAYVSQGVMHSILRTQSNRLMYRDTGLLTGWQAHLGLNMQRKLNKQWRRVRKTAETLAKR